MRIPRHTAIVHYARLVVLSLLLARAHAETARGSDSPEANPEYSAIESRVAKLLPSKHLTRFLLNDTISQRTWTNYLASLDYERVYFLQSDVDPFRNSELLLDDQLSEGRLEFAHEVTEVFKQRVANRCRFVDDLLAKGFDLTKDETYVIRRKDVPWPANEEEWDDLWRRKIKNEYLRQIIGREFSEQSETNAVDHPTTNATATTPSADLSATNANRAAMAANADESAAAGTTNGPAAKIKPPTPEEVISQRYAQMLTVLQDSDTEWVLQKYLSALAQAYDPHSLYMTPDAEEDFEIEMKLSLVGIGALLRAEDGAAKIIRLIPGGPADRDKSKTRLQPGDKIIAVGQGDEEPVDILHRPLNKIVRLIRGEKGTKVVLLVIPASDPTESTTKTVEIVRDEVQLEEQAASTNVRTVTAGNGTVRKLGVLTLPAFYANLQARSVNDPEFRSCSFDVAKGIETLLQEGAEGIVLDLRNNGGGSLLEAIRMVGLFIRTGPTVMVRDRRAIRVLPDEDPAIAYSGPLLVLVNRLSASASEIVTGALQDYGRAVIVGDSKTHGKGTVQTILQLGLDPQLGSVKVTTASYYRITGSSTQLRGIKPDIVVPSPFDFMEMGEEFLPYAIEWSMVPPSSYAPVADLHAVIDTLRTRSEERRGTDKRYEVYKTLLQRMKVLSEEREVPLQIDKRRMMAAAEKELADLQEKLSPVREDESTKEEGGKDRDVVLDEALKILCDFAGFSEATMHSEPVEAATNDEKSWPALIEQMLKNL